VYPLSGAFASASDTTAASKLKIGRAVAATPATVTLADLNKSPNAFDTQAIVVADVHYDVIHAPRSPAPPRSSPAVIVGSSTPKSSPETVTDAYPLCGAFRRASDTTAASKLKPGADVPATPPTLTADSPNIVLIELL
jgi:hypothetical protein